MPWTQWGWAEPGSQMEAAYLQDQLETRRRQDAFNDKSAQDIETRQANYDQRRADERAAIQYRYLASQGKLPEQMAQTQLLQTQTNNANADRQTQANLEGSRAAVDYGRLEQEGLNRVENARQFDANSRQRLYEYNTTGQERANEFDRTQGQQAAEFNISHALQNQQFYDNQRHQDATQSRLDQQFQQSQYQQRLLAGFQAYHQDASQQTLFDQHKALNDQQAGIHSRQSAQDAEQQDLSFERKFTKQQQQKLIQQQNSRDRVEELYAQGYINPTQYNDAIRQIEYAVAGIKPTVMPKEQKYAQGQGNGDVWTDAGGALLTRDKDRVHILTQPHPPRDQDGPATKDVVHLATEMQKNDFAKYGKTRGWVPPAFEEYVPRAVTFLNDVKTRQAEARDGQLGANVNRYTSGQAPGAPSAPAPVDNGLQTYEQAKAEGKRIEAVPGGFVAVDRQGKKTPIQRHVIMPQPRDQADDFGPPPAPVPASVPAARPPQEPAPTRPQEPGQQYYSGESPNNAPPPPTSAPAAPAPAPAQSPARAQVDRYFGNPQPQAPAPSVTAPVAQGAPPPARGLGETPPPGNAYNSMPQAKTAVDYLRTIQQQATAAKDNDAAVAAKRLADLVAQYGTEEQMGQVERAAARSYRKEIETYTRRK